jgi:hypothetical protein
LPPEFSSISKNKFEHFSPFLLLFIKYPAFNYTTFLRNKKEQKINLLLRKPEIFVNVIDESEDFKNRKKSVTFGFLMFHRPPPVYFCGANTGLFARCDLLISAPVGEFWLPAEKKRLNIFRTGSTYKSNPTIDL